MKLFYDPNDLPHAVPLKDERFRWLQELGAEEIDESRPDEAGYLFAYQHADDRYARLVAARPNVADRPEARDELFRLDDVLRRLAERRIELPTPRTWRIDVDDPLPADLEYPLFVRTPKSSWKRGGTQGRAKNERELVDEMELLRRAFGWNTPILARKWIDVAVAGKYMYGDAPQEIRVWIVDRVPAAWSFHYLHVVRDPRGFPPSADELHAITEMAAKIGAAFDARLIAADFIRDRKGKWWFLEAGPGSAAGTAHEAVFKFVAERLRATARNLVADAVGGPLD